MSDGSPAVDTIRRSFAALNEFTPPEIGAAAEAQVEEAIAAFVAERDAIASDYQSMRAELEADIAALREACDSARRERGQAVDALDRIARGDFGIATAAANFARAVLVDLGESKP